MTLFDPKLSSALAILRYVAAAAPDQATPAHGKGFAKSGVSLGTA